MKGSVAGISRTIFRQNKAHVVLKIYHSKEESPFTAQELLATFQRFWDCLVRHKIAAFWQALTEADDSKFTVELEKTLMSTRELFSLKSS